MVVAAIKLLGSAAICAATLLHPVGKGGLWLDSDFL